MDSATTLTTDAVTDPHTRDLLWQAYETAFKDAEELCIQAQTCYDRTSFSAALEDKAYMKFVLFSDAGQPLGFILATNDLDKAKIAYVNPQRLRNLYPDDAAAGRIWYVTALAIKPEAQGRRLSGALYDAIAVFISGCDGLIAFDFSEDKIPDFPVFSAALLNNANARLSTGKAVYTKLGGQTYGVFKLTKDR